MQNSSTIISHKLHINIDCPHCADLIETKIAALPQVEEVSVSSLTRQLTLRLKKDSDYPDTLEKIRAIADAVEPSTVITEQENSGANRYKLFIGIDCPHCADIIETKIAALQEVTSVSVSALTKQIVLTLANPGDFAKTVTKIRQIAEAEEPSTVVEEQPSAGRQYLYYINIDCAHCADLIETAINKLPEIKEASVTLTTKQLRFTPEDSVKLSTALEAMRATAEQIEPGTVITKSMGETKAQQDSFLTRVHEKFHPFELIIGGTLFILLEFTSLFPAEYLTPLFIAAYLLLGIHVIKNSLTNIFRGRIFDENFLMTVATVGAFLIGQHPEAVGVMLFYRIGEAFEAYATNRSRRQIISAVDLRPETVHLFKSDGTTGELPAEDVQIGDIIIVRPGERIPVDGTVLEGESRLDTSPVTGESLPVKTEPGREIISGCINLNSTLKIEVIRDLSNSMVSRILDSVENAAANKPKLNKFITRFARVYTPFVVGIAALTAIVPSLFTGNWDYWIYTALTFLVISCPCALVLSVPLAFFSGIGLASQYGILFKGGISMEALAKVKAVAFDKTGTLTKGNFTLREIRALPPYSSAELLTLCAGCEQISNHPIAQSILDYARQQQIELPVLTDAREISGEGILAISEGRELLCGNRRLLEHYGVALPDAFKDITDTVVLLAVNKVFAGSVTIGDQLKPDAVNTVHTLEKWGLTTAIFTGDNAAAAAKIAAKLGIAKVFAKLLPQDKLARLQDLRREKGSVLFVGDGINDAPILAGADVSAAMGSGADAAIEAADLVFMNSKLQSVLNAFKIAKATLAIAWQNVAFALLIKAAVMLCGLMGYASMWAAVFADSGVTLLCVLNSLRLFGKRYPK